MTSPKSRDYRRGLRIIFCSNNHNRLNILKTLNVDFANKIRTSINLVKGGIDNKTKLIESLHFLNTIGCKHIKINELQNVNENLYVNFEEIMNIKLKSPFTFGCQTLINDCFNNSNLPERIELKRSCFIVQPKNKRNITILDLLKYIFKEFIIKKNNKFLVLYENGDLKNKWETKNN